MKSAVTISLVPEARGGPFVFWDGLEAGAAQAAKLGFDAIEVFPPDAATLRACGLGSILTRFGLGLAAVGTGGGWVKHRLRLTDPDPAVRREAAAFVRDMAGAAAELGAPIIVGSMQGRWGEGVERAAALDWMRDAILPAAERAAARGLPLLIEPLNRYETNLLVTLADAAAWVDSLPLQNVKILADLFHANLEEASMSASLRAAGGRVGHVHFADSNRRAVGFGHTSMGAVIDTLRAIGYAGYLSAEILPLPDSLEAAAQSMRSFRELTVTPRSGSQPPEAATTNA